MRTVIAKLSLAYFGSVFAVGFSLGVVRVLWLVPFLGDRNAELLETPFMLAAIVISARYLVGQWFRFLTESAALVAGILATLILLAFEFTIVLYVRGLTIGDYVATRDPVSGAVYGISILLFSLMPVLEYRRAGRARTVS